VLSDYNANVLNPSYYSLGTAYLNASVANPYAGLLPGSLGAATITRANLLKPYPYYTGVHASYPRFSLEKQVLFYKEGRLSALPHSGLSAGKSFAPS
jgi:hypothetical protein